MAAMMAHEIRNPLGGIKGFASLLQRDLKEHPELEEMAGYIVKGTENLNRLVTNILNYARPLAPSFEVIDLASFLNSFCKSVRSDETLSRGIKFVVMVPSTPIYASIDPQHMHAALLNLILNAIQAMSNDGTVTLKLETRDGQVLIHVIDEGVGIANEGMVRLFTPLTTKAGGNGFGLAEVYKVVQAHSGTVEVASEVGKGSTFTIKLPPYKAPKLEEIMPVEKVLVVDDEPLVRNFIAETLRRKKPDVSTAENGKTALAQLKNTTLDMVITDMKMPDLTGLDVLKKVKELNPETVVVVVTAFGSIDNAVEAMKLGAFNYLLKPFTPDTIEAVVEKANQHLGLIEENQFLRREVSERSCLRSNLLLKVQ